MRATRVLGRIQAKSSQRRTTGEQVQLSFVERRELDLAGHLRLAFDQRHQVESSRPGQIAFGIGLESPLLIVSRAKVGLSRVMDCPVWLALDPRFMINDLNQAKAPQRRIFHRSGYLQHRLGARGFLLNGTNDQRRC